MSTNLLAFLVIVPTLSVIAALCFVMWDARTTPATSRAAILAGAVLATWAVAVIVLGLQGAFVQPDEMSVPPMGIALLVISVTLIVALRGSRSLRSLLTNQRHLIRLNVWRLLGIVFLLLMLDGQVPALWALPAGIGDIIVGASAFRVADRLGTPSGRKIAVAFHLFGLADLVVAVALGVMTNAGPLQLFHTAPTSELLTRFPLLLVPAFLVPLAFTLHVVSLRQLSGAIGSRVPALASS